MAEKPIQVRRESPKYKTLDFEFLKSMGIDLVQQLSGTIWTDYNPHDPGITILEQLCYGLADLGFRTDFTIQDLLNARSRKKRKKLNNTFFDASEILPAAALSIKDYRRLLIDRLPQVKNAWLEPIKDNLQGIEGLYRVSLQVDEEARQQKGGIEKLKDAVYELFAEHRNLCEDIEEVNILDVEDIVIYAEIEISSDVVGEEILANIRFQLEEYLNPTIRFYTLEELLEEGKTVDEVFDGPAPVHGFIKDEDLRPIRQEIYISKLIELISAVEGVRRISYFKVEKSGILIEGDVIQLEPNSYPVLAIDPIEEKYSKSSPDDYPIQFFRGSLKYDIDLNTANQLLYTLYAQYSKGYKMEMLYNERDYPSVLKPEEISEYYSVQNLFPLTYGLNKYGLPSNIAPTRERLAMIKQLRGYMLFFEQMMANYLAQLGNLGQFFSINPDVEQSYYSQVPTDIPELAQLVKGADLERFQKRLNELMREFDPFAERRNKVLDHLLARFGEQFSTDFLIRMNASNDPDLDSDREIIRTKIDFLGHYVQVSRNRGVGYNYLQYKKEEWNVSGLQKRLSLFTQIPAHGMGSLYSVIDEGKEANEALQTEALKPFPELVICIEPKFASTLDWEALQAKYREKELGKQDDEQLGALDELLGGGEEQAPESKIIEIYAPADADQGMDYSAGDFFYFPATDSDMLIQELLANGIYTYNYVILPIEGKELVAVYYKQGKQAEIVKVAEAPTLYEARKKVTALVSYLRQINRLTEGMHIVEHVLLRPQSKDRHGFRFINDQEEVLLQSYELGDAQEQRFLSDDLPQAGAKKENYQIDATETGKWQVCLKNDYGNFVAKMPKLFATLPQAQAQVADLIDYIESFKAGGISLFNNVVFFVEQSKIAPVNDSFYSLSNSIVLPAWPLRFRNNDFRQLFRNLVMMNVPAHLEVNFFWLNLSDMRTFEELFFAWQEARANVNPKQPQLDEASYKLLEWFAEQMNKEE